MWKVLVGEIRIVEVNSTPLTCLTMFFHKCFIRPMQTNCIFGGYAAATSTKKHPKVSALQALAIVCLILLASSIAIGYLSYSAITNANTALNDLKSNYQNLTQQYAGLQSNYSSLQENTSNLQQNLSQLQSTYLSSQANFSLLQTQIAQLKALFNTSQTLQSTLQTQFSNLQANYTSIQSANQALGNASSFSYLVFTDANGTAHAENGTTKALDYSGPSASSVAQACIDALHDSGGKIIFAGKISLDNPLTVLDGETAGLLELSGLGPSTQLVSSHGSDCIDISGRAAFRLRWTLPHGHKRHGLDFGNFASRKVHEHWHIRQGLVWCRR